MKIYQIESYDSVFKWGKHAKKTLKEIMYSDPEYITRLDKRSLIKFVTSSFRSKILNNLPEPIFLEIEEQFLTILKSVVASGSNNHATLRLIALNKTKYYGVISKIAFNGDKNNELIDVFYTSGKTDKCKASRIFTLMNISISDIEVENFMNVFKACIFGQDKVFELITDPNAIQYYYLENNYEPRTAQTTGSQLHGSCMRLVAENNRIRWYGENGVSLLILKNINTNKIVGRALVWQNVYCVEDKCFCTFMDRIYTISDYFTTKFKLYAKEHEWLRKSNQSAGSYPIVKPNDTQHTLHLVYYIKNESFVRHPYMDTFNQIQHVYQGDKQYYFRGANGLSADTATKAFKEFENKILSK